MFNILLESFTAMNVFICVDFTLNGGQARVISSKYLKNGVIFEVDGVLRIPTDLTSNTVMAVSYTHLTLPTKRIV